jgi:hypothetical protein
MKMIRSMSRRSVLAVFAASVLAGCIAEEPSSKQMGPGEPDSPEAEDPTQGGASDFQVAPIGPARRDTGSGSDAGNLLSPTLAVYQALLALDDGAPLNTLSAVSGGAEYLAIMQSRLPVSGAPNAFCRNVTVPVNGPEGCTELYPELVDGGSHDPNFEGSGTGAFEGLEPQLSQSSLCGAGQHTVALTTYDYDGNFSSCESTVRLCDAADPSCPDETTFDSPTIAIADQPQEAITCHWNLVTSASPEPTKSNPSARTKRSNGRGPNHSQQSSVLEWRNCLAENAEESHSPLSGDTNVDANVVCTDAAGNNAEPECKSTVELRAFYRSDVEAYSDTWSIPCPWGFCRVEALAQDEARFSVNGAEAFNKAVVVQNGSVTSTSVTLELGGELGKSQEGASASLSASVGISYTLTKNTAHKIDALNADGYASQDVPVSARLQSKGSGYLKAEDRSWAFAGVRTGHWIVALVGKSNCPGAGTTYWWDAEDVVGVLDEGLPSDVAAINAFFETRNVDGKINW